MVRAVPVTATAVARAAAAAATATSMLQLGPTSQPSSWVGRWRAGLAGHRRRGHRHFARAGRPCCSSYSAMRRLRWQDSMSSSMATAAVAPLLRRAGCRKGILMQATQLFHCQWLLEDWAEESCKPTLDICRECLRALHAHFAELLWGLDPAQSPYSDSPIEMFETVSFDSLWEQYLRCHDLARQAASRSAIQVEPVYEVVSYTVRLHAGR